jgi:sugar/nucleoside kinase (ribokinase family)
MVQLVTIGELTLDQIVLPDGTVKSNVIGGGSLFSAIGARIWDVSVGIHAITGGEFFRATIQNIAARGIDTTGIHHIPGNGLEMWLLHESTTVKQQIPKLSSANMADLDAARKPLPKEYQTAKAFHLAPQSPEGHWRSLNALKQLSPKPLISMDIQADTIIDSSQYRNLSFCSQLSAFLPSREEVQQIWQTHDLAGWMNTVAFEATGCIAVKMGDQGSLVWNPVTQKIFEVPAYPTHVVDTTGAGDAYCGGFLAGFMLGRDVVTCAAMGTVSASFAIETYGALGVSLPSSTERSDRLRYVINRTSNLAGHC